MSRAAEAPRPVRAGRSRVTPARRAAYTVLRRVFADGAWTDRALHAAARNLEARERALATQLAFGAVQRAGTLDHVASQLSARPAAELDGPVRDIVRLGLFQLLFLDGIPDHAAVASTVDLANAEAPRAAGLVNAVLRRAARGEGAQILAALDDATPDGAAVKHSVPAWLAELWFAELGADEARALLQAVNTPAEAALRVNTLVTTRDDLLAGGAIPAHAAADVPEALVLDGPFDAHGDPLWDRGAYQPQSRAAMRVARAVDPQPGERILDLCAAPGGKTTHLAALMGGEGEVVAVERHPARANALVRTVSRLRADGVVRVEVADARDARADGPFDRVLVDPPCSGLGTLQSRPDLRWHARPESISELAEVQAAILDVAAAATRPGGRLVYSTCTISRHENEGQIEAFLDRHGDFSRGVTTVTLPHRDGTDGFFIATLARNDVRGGV